MDNALNVARNRFAMLRFLSTCCRGSLRALPHRVRGRSLLGVIVKFQKTDAAFFASRSALPDHPWQLTDNWPLYVGFANLARTVAMTEIVKRALTVPGHIAEFGVYRGANLMLIAKLMRLFDPMGCKEVHGFDAFEGLETFTDEDRSATDHRGEFAGNFDLLKTMIEMHGLDEVQVHKGLIQDTFPKLIEARPEISFSLVLLDTDLFEPTKIVLDRIHEMLSRGGMIVCDEWNHSGYPGETAAVREFLARHGDDYRMEHPIGTRNPTLILVKA